MVQRDKLIARLKAHPRDFTFDEAEALLGMLGFRRSNRGRTSGSRVMFKRGEGQTFFVHIPHPGRVLKAYQVKELQKMLEREELI